MRRLVLIAIFFIVYSALSARPNYAAIIHDHRAWTLDAHGPYVKSGCSPAVPTPSLTLDPFACRAYVPSGENADGIRQDPAAVGPLNLGNNTYWIAVHNNWATPVPGWTRQPFGTHYLWRALATQPANPPGGLVFARVVVAGGIITQTQRIVPMGLPRAHCINTDQYGSVQDALELAPVGATVCVNQDETLSGLLLIDRPLRLMGTGGTLTFSTNAIDQGILITSSDVHIERIRVVGPQSNTFVARQIGVFFDGPDVNNHLSNVTIRDSHISNFGDMLLQFRFAENFAIENNVLEDAFSHGIFVNSSRDGVVHGNKVHRIDRDGVCCNDAYGIQLSKNDGSEADRPVPRRIIVSGNVVTESITWACYDTHGGRELIYANNIGKNCRFGLNITSFLGFPGSELGPQDIVLSNNVLFNDHGPGETITEQDQGYGIGINGNLPTGALGQNIVVQGNVVDGFGQQNATVDATFSGSLTAQFISGLRINGNIFQNNHRNAMTILSVSGFSAVGNSIFTIIGGAPPGTAIGSINLTGLPADGDTIEVNGATFTFRNTVTVQYEILIGASVAQTVTNIQQALGSNSEQDGRIHVATYTDFATNVGVTHRHVGRTGNNFTLSESGSNLTVSGATLVGGSIGSAGIHFGILSGGTMSSGFVANNMFSLTGYTAMQMDADNVSLDFSNNRVTNGTPYDLKGSGPAPQSGSGNIDGLARSVFTSDPDAITVGNTGTIYLPAPGVSESSSVNITLSRPLEGLIMSARGDSRGYVAVSLNNSSGGTVNLGSASWILDVNKIAFDR